MVEEVGEFEVCKEEEKWSVRRNEKVTEALKKLLGKDYGECNIGLASSGGGVRAMIGFTGALMSLKNEGILDCVKWMAGGSGSTWTLSVLMRQMELNPDLTLDEAVKKTYEEVQICCEKPWLHDLGAMSNSILESLYTKIAYNQSLSLVDIYGAILGHRFPTSATLSVQKVGLESGEIPLPIYTAAIVDTGEKKVRLEEFTPFAISLKNLFIPPWALGRPFDNGKSIDDEIPEISMR